MNKIVKTALHPEGDNSIDLYPKTSIDQVVGLNEELDGLKTAQVGEPYFYNGLLKDGGVIDTSLLIPQTIPVESSKIIDKSAQLFQVVLANGELVVEQLTKSSEYNEEIIEKIDSVETDLTNKITVVDMDLEAKIAEVDANSVSRNAATLDSAKQYTDEQDQNVLEQAKQYTDEQDQNVLEQAKQYTNENNKKLYEYNINCIHAITSPLYNFSFNIILNELINISNDYNTLSKLLSKLSNKHIPVCGAYESGSIIYIISTNTYIFLYYVDTSFNIKSTSISNNANTMSINISVREL